MKSVDAKPRAACGSRAQMPSDNLPDASCSMNVVLPAADTPSTRSTRSIAKDPRLFDITIQRQKISPAFVLERCAAMAAGALVVDQQWLAPIPRIVQGRSV